MKLELEEAVAQIRAAVRPLPSEEVPAEAALGRVLAEDVRAAVTQPPFDRSALDGYALRAADTGETPGVCRCWRRSMPEAGRRTHWSQDRPPAL